MSTDPRPTRLLPAVPNLEQQKKQARELLDAAHAKNPEALARLRAAHPRFQNLSDAEFQQVDLSLHHAQLAIAREYGFASWPKLKEHIEGVAASRRTHLIERKLEYYDDRAHGLLEVLGDGDQSTFEQVRGWHPDFADASDATILAASSNGSFSIDDARLVYAREHGFANWDALASHLREIETGKKSEPLIQILEAGHKGQWRRVNELLRSHRELVRVRGTNGNTLLNLACSVLPCLSPSGLGNFAMTLLGGDRLGPVRLLLAAGADPNERNDRGWAPLHQAAYRNDVEMVALLLEAGARIDFEAHGTGGTPLAVALFWGHREAADRLAEAGVAPRNLRTAAGLGRVDLVDECFASDGSLTPEACDARGFYRPHSGFPKWRPREKPQEVLDEALVWAAKSDRISAMPVLVEHGAQVGADPYRGTALLWAAFNGRVAAATWLLENGADVNQRATFGGESHGRGVTALHLAAQNGHIATVRLLLDRGGDPKIEDELYHGSAAGWADHFGHAKIKTLLDAWQD